MALDTKGRKPVQHKWRACVNKMCKQCIYDSYGYGTWRQQVENCTDIWCGLYPIRPVSKGDGDALDVLPPKERARVVAVLKRRHAGADR